MTSRRALIGLFALSAVAAIGCSDDLPRASEIKAMRVLGARTEVQGDPERSTPKPGESANVTWSVVFPDLDRDNGELSSLLATCTAPTRFSGVPVCQELLDAAQGSRLVEVLGAAGGLRRSQTCAENPDQRIEAGPFSVTCVTGTPHSNVTIEKDFKARAKLVQGIICRNATPMFDADDPTGVRCEPHAGVKASQVESIPVYGTVPVQYLDKDENHNPSMDAANFRFGVGELDWPVLAPEDSAALIHACGEAAVDGRVLSSNGKDEQLFIEYDASAREIQDGEPEPLEFSTYVTLGTLDRRFTVFGPDAEKPFKEKLKWNVTKALRDKLGDDSQLVRFYFTLLDHRGGFSITSRELCVGRNLTKN